MTIFREQIAEWANGYQGYSAKQVQEMAEEILSYRKQDPVTWSDCPFSFEELSGMSDVKFANGFIRGWARKCESVTMKGPLYSLPAPVVPDSKVITPYFDTIALEVAREIMCDVNRRREFLGGDCQLLSRIQCRIDDACRAAMLNQAPVKHPSSK